MSGRHDKSGDEEQSAKLLLTGPIVIRGLGRGVKDAFRPGRPSRHRAFVADQVEEGVPAPAAAAPAPLDWVLSGGPTVDDAGPSSSVADEPRAADAASASASDTEEAPASPEAIGPDAEVPPEPDGQRDAADVPPETPQDGLEPEDRADESEASNENATEPVGIEDSTEAELVVGVGEASTSGAFTDESRAEEAQEAADPEGSIDHGETEPEVSADVEDHADLQPESEGDHGEAAGPDSDDIEQPASELADEASGDDVLEPDHDAADVHASAVLTGGDAAPTADDADPTGEDQPVAGAEDAEPADSDGSTEDEALADEVDPDADPDVETDGSGAAGDEPGVEQPADVRAVDVVEAEPGAVDTAQTDPEDAESADPEFAESEPADVEPSAHEGADAEPESEPEAEPADAELPDVEATDHESGSVEEAEDFVEEPDGAAGEPGSSAEQAEDAAPEAEVLPILEPVAGADAESDLAVGAESHVDAADLERAEEPAEADDDPDADASGNDDAEARAFLLAMDHRADEQRVDEEPTADPAPESFSDAPQVFDGAQPDADSDLGRSEDETPTDADGMAGEEPLAEAASDVSDGDRDEPEPEAAAEPQTDPEQAEHPDLPSADLVEADAIEAEQDAEAEAAEQDVAPDDLTEPEPEPEDAERGDADAGEPDADAPTDHEPAPADVQDEDDPSGAESVATEPDRDALTGPDADAGSEHQPADVQDEGDPSGTESDVTESDVTESDVTESDVTESDVTESDVTESDVTESDVAEPGPDDSNEREGESSDTPQAEAGTDVAGTDAGEQAASERESDPADVQQDESRVDVSDTESGEPDETALEPESVDAQPDDAEQDDAEQHDDRTDATPGGDAEPVDAGEPEEEARADDEPVLEQRVLPALAPARSDAFFQIDDSLVLTTPDDRALGRDDHADPAVDDPSDEPTPERGASEEIVHPDPDDVDAFFAAWAAGGAGGEPGEPARKAEGAEDAERPADGSNGATDATDEPAPAAPHVDDPAVDDTPLAPAPRAAAAVALTGAGRTAGSNGRPPKRPAARPAPGRRPSRGLRDRVGREAVGIAVLVVLALVCAALITAVVLKTQRDAAIAASEAANYTPPPLATPSASPTPTPTGPKVAVIGDASSLQAAPGVTPRQRWTGVLESAVKGDVITNASAGMGYAAKSAGGQTFVQAARKVPADADVVVFLGGAADANVSTLSIAKAATDAYSAAKQRAPDAKVIVVGPVISAGLPDITMRTLRSTLQRSATIGQATWIDPINDAWLPPAARAAASPTVLTVSNEKTIATKLQTAVEKALGSS